MIGNLQNLKGITFMSMTTPTKFQYIEQLVPLLRLLRQLPRQLPHHLHQLCLLPQHQSNRHRLVDSSHRLQLQASRSLLVVELYRQTEVVVEDRRVGVAVEDRRAEVAVEDHRAVVDRHSAVLYLLHLLRCRYYRIRTATQ